MSGSFYGFNLEAARQGLPELFVAPLDAVFECEHGWLVQDPRRCGCWDRARRVRASGPGTRPSTDFAGTIE